MRARVCKFAHSTRRGPFTIYTYTRGRALFDRFFTHTHTHKNTPGVYTYSHLFFSKKIARKPPLCMYSESTRASKKLYYGTWCGQNAPNCLPGPRELREYIYICIDIPEAVWYLLAGEKMPTGLRQTFNYTISPKPITDQHAHTRTPGVVRKKDLWKLPGIR